MHETRRIDLKRPSRPEIEQAAADLQKQLLQLRFEKYKKLSLPKTQGDGKLHSRMRDLYEALALPSGEDADVCKWLVKRFTAQQESNREPLPPKQSAVLRTLFYFIHDSVNGTDLVKNLTRGANWLLRAEGEPFHMTPREVGVVLPSLGFTKRKRTNDGYKMMFDPSALRRIHELFDSYASYDVRGLPESLRELRERCDLCNELAARKRRME